MNRPRIDRAVRQQLARLEALLRDCRCGGDVTWNRLFSRGHHFPTIMSAVRQGYLDRNGYRFKIMPAGIEHIRTLDEALYAGTSE